MLVLDATELGRHSFQILKAHCLGTLILVLQLQYQIVQKFDFSCQLYKCW